MQFSSKLLHIDIYLFRFIYLSIWNWERHKPRERGESSLISLFIPEIFATAKAKSVKSGSHKINPGVPCGCQRVSHLSLWLAAFYNLYSRKLELSIAGIWTKVSLVYCGLPTGGSTTKPDIYTYVCILSLSLNLERNLLYRKICKVNKSLSFYRSSLHKSGRN